MAKNNDNNPYRDFLYSGSIDQMAVKMKVNRRTIGFWRQGKFMPCKASIQLIKKLTKGRVSTLDIATYHVLMSAQD